jgi:alkylhydroperoxidase family enzyme
LRHQTGLTVHRALQNRQIRGLARDVHVAILSQIAIINAFNRLNIILRRPAGDYQPGQFG